MPKVSSTRRIVPEDFAPDMQDTAAKIAGPVNDFSDEIIQVINGSLDFDNLARRMITLDVTVDANGKPTTQLKLATGLGFVSMIHIGKVFNKSSNVARLTSAPYVDWTYTGGGFITVNYFLGLTAGTKYSITLEIVQ